MFQTALKKSKRILLLVILLFLFGGRPIILTAENPFEYDYEEPHASDLIPFLESELSILIDVSTGHVLHENGMHERGYPASMTKVMTALLLIEMLEESGLPLETPIFHSHDAISSVIPWHSGILEVGQTITAEQSLYAIMLPSANDVSNAIAEFVSGSMEEFAALMTQRAHELGAVNTNFTNAHGLWEPEHYTTPYDMALIMARAIRHELFVDIIATQRMIIPPDAYHEDYRTRDNSNRMLFPNDTHFNPYIVGGKTGWTTPSRHTLVSYGTRGDIELITVIMAADHRDIIFADTRALMDYGFDQFETLNVFSADGFLRSLDLVQRSGEGVLSIGTIDIVPSNDVVLSLPRGLNTGNITTNIQIPDRIAAPVNENFVVGRILLEYNGNILGETELKTASAGHALTPQELAALFPASSPAGYLLAYENDPLPLFALIANISLAALAMLLLTFLFIRILRFTDRRKRPVKYRGHKGYKPSVIYSNHKYRYRYRD